MSKIERMTVTLSAEMAEDVKGAIEGGDYASASEVVRDALRDWKHKRAQRQFGLASLKADIDLGMADIEAGRVKDFDPDRILERGRSRLFQRAD